jgi:hypothetical protein
VRFLLPYIRHDWARSYGVVNPKSTGLNLCMCLYFLSRCLLCILSVSDEKASNMMAEISSCSCFYDLFITADAS